MFGNQSIFFDIFSAIVYACSSATIFNFYPVLKHEEKKQTHLSIELCKYKLPQGRYDKMPHSIE